MKVFNAWKISMKKVYIKESIGEKNDYGVEDKDLMIVYDKEDAIITIKECVEELAGYNYEPFVWKRISRIDESSMYVRFDSFKNSECFEIRAELKEFIVN